MGKSRPVFIGGRILQGSFWNTYMNKSSAPSSIDTLLEKEDCALEELLDDEDLLQTIKYNNEKLI